MVKDNAGMCPVLSIVVKNNREDISDVDEKIP